jgi:hypothetical protein
MRGEQEDFRPFFASRFALGKLNAKGTESGGLDENLAAAG